MRMLHPKSQKNKGWTLVELSVVVTLIAIFASYVIPGFQRTFEISRVDLAAAHLETIWAAQRIYWLKNKQFCSNLQVLSKEGLVGKEIQEASFQTCRSCPFVYRVESADEVGFTVIANRTGSDRWRGELMINQEGQLRGIIEDLHSNYTISPSKTL